MKPLLKWAGGKAKQARMIGGLFGPPCKGVYFEPFAGSAAVFFHLKSAGRIRHAVLSDVNHKLAGMYVSIRDDVDGVLRELAAMPSDGWADRYYEVRTAFNAGPFNTPESAARLLWLNRACYNGLYRENRSGDFNVPRGKYAALSPPTEDHIREASRLLQDTEILGASFADVLREVGPGDYAYCDPPYVPLSKTSNFTGYAGEFGMDRQRELALSAWKAGAAGAVVLLSNHDLPIVRDDLYPTGGGFRMVARLPVKRSISARYSSRGHVFEAIFRTGPEVGPVRE